jgi:hypothetical protein
MEPQPPPVPSGSANPKLRLAQQCNIKSFEGRENILES